MNLLLDTLKTRRSLRLACHGLGLLAGLGLAGLAGGWRAARETAFAYGVFVTGLELLWSLLDFRLRRLKRLAPTVFPLKKMEALERVRVQSGLAMIPRRSVLRAVLVWSAAFLLVGLLRPWGPTADDALFVSVALPASALLQGLGNDAMLRRVLPFFYFEGAYARALASWLPGLRGRLAPYLLGPLVMLGCPLLAAAKLGHGFSGAELAWVLALTAGLILAELAAFDSLVVGPTRDLEAALRRLSQGQLNALLDVTGGDEVAAASEAYNQAARAVDRRLFVLEKFGHSVLPGRSEGLLEDLRLDGEARPVALLCACWASADEDLAALPPPSRAAALSRFFELVQGQVDAQQGCTEGLEHGALTAVWGAPFREEGALAKAAACAWELKPALEVWAMQQRMRGLPAPRWGLGLSAGEALAGLLGPKGRERYLVFGAPAAAARRLAAAGEGLRLDAASAQALPEPFAVQPAGDAFALCGGPPPPSAAPAAVLDFQPGSRL